MATGTVKWSNDAKGYGFIIPDVGTDDLFAHFPEVCSEGFKTLHEHQSELRGQAGTERPASPGNRSPLR